MSLEALSDEVIATGLSPKPGSDRQQLVEREVDRYIWSTFRMANAVHGQAGRRDLACGLRPGLSMIHTRHGIGATMGTTRWAMIGTGFMLELIGRDLALTENLEMSVIVSRTAERAASAVATYGFREGATDVDAVLRRDDIDVVYVATPHSEHHRLARAALEAGKHVLVEKPMTVSPDHTRDVCELAASRGLFAMEAMWTAFNPAIVELRRRIGAGMFGDINAVHANFCIPVPYRTGSRLWERDLAGGSTLDQGVYTATLAHMVLGVPTSITAQGTVVHDVDAEVSVTLEYASGQRAQTLTSLLCQSPLTAYVAGTQGHATIPGPFWNPGGFVQFAEAGGAFLGDEFAYEREGSGYVPMLRAVSQAIIEGRTEHELRSHADTIAVAETMAEVLRQVHRRTPERR